MLKISGGNVKSIIFSYAKIRPEDLFYPPDKTAQEKLSFGL